MGNFKFYKYHGTGNDFILIDNRKLTFDFNDTDLIKKLCHRRFGIGADGLILLQNSVDVDFEMIYFNNDGNISSMCGNGGRCIVAFAKELNIINTITTFNAPDGIHRASIKDGIVSLQMKDVTTIKQIGQDFYLDTGSPHYVKIIEDHQNWDTKTKGSEIRNSREFKEIGTNVNFISKKNNKNILTTYERGVEDETYSCGTGTVAAAVVLGLLSNETHHQFHTKGGVLEVIFKKTGESFTNIILKGSTNKVYEGWI